MSKRELIDTGTDKRYVRRDEKGQFKESVDVGRSLSADKGRKANHDAKPGEATGAITIRSTEGKPCQRMSPVKFGFCSNNWSIASL
ncbi:hypothetical protein QO002_003002 [Pararhizobium capsulatum DSM 1112]|uniref:Uncharacterized protein n=1 Tax=Pararhizobium capsulatum DSM 1112 TaxID=1121113 RepID=A0ABU0BRK6_9HYPH|nr:hypothetical protein [Pararhizobium capsulatum DSM 1112]